MNDDNDADFYFFWCFLGLRDPYRSKNDQDQIVRNRRQQQPRCVP